MLRMGVGAARKVAVATTVLTGLKVDPVALAWKV